jgi:mannose-1-phosphate guanylyltransferase
MVKKPWGHEEWLSDGKRMPYALKKILFKAGHRSSLQVHEFKKETNHVISGNGILLRGTEIFPCKDYVEGMLTKDEIENYINDLKEIPLSPGMTFDVTPGIIHRVIANTDLLFIEASTSELDDVIRLQDDANRSHGKIDSEHA